MSVWEVLKGQNMSQCPVFVHTLPHPPTQMLKSQTELNWIWISSGGNSGERLRVPLKLAWVESLRWKRKRKRKRKSNIAQVSTVLLEK